MRWECLRGGNFIGAARVEELECACCETCRAFYGGKGHWVELKDRVKVGKVGDDWDGGVVGGWMDEWEEDDREGIVGIQVAGERRSTWYK